MRITIGELAEVIGGKVIYGKDTVSFSNITTSSNRIKGEDLFIPVRGERTDGHKYIAQALLQGAACSLTDREEIVEDLDRVTGEYGIVLCDNTVRALQKFGAWYRKNRVRIPYIGITGSVGKTTTREITAKALSAGFSVYTTKGNANSQVGVPITVFETDPEAGIGVLELGISEFGEMEIISDLASCDTACITNIGVSHIAQFKTQENILREKLLIIKNLPDGGTLFVNGDDPILRDLTEEKIHSFGLCKEKRVRVRYFGTGDNAEVRAENIRKENGCVSFDACFMESGVRIPVQLSVPGDHMVLNALCALSVCELYGVDLTGAARKLSEFENFEGRGNRITVNGIDFINDSYNASPVSVKAGISVLTELPAKGRRIAVLADMKELGENEILWHRETGAYINEKITGLDLLFTYGELAGVLGEEVEKKGKVKVSRFTDFDCLKKALFEELSEGDLCFLKGSNSMGLWRILS